MAVIIAGTCMPKAEYNQLLGKLVEGLDGQKGISDYTARVMVVGSCVDDVAFIELVEDVGGLVVADYSCFGPLYFYDLADESLDPIDGLAKRYLRGLSCPRMIGGHADRTRFIIGMAKDFGVKALSVSG